ncbi:response regulator transcription factor [Actinomycetospora lutea]|uniref:response regulator n=1 Tax=Actinomycetospora lutea TaxID=663604 RepID=UPI0023666112|nr:response regulator transcription factor [Actinomycetospora lutea]MDD7939280.1 response regulator transcription factor [Actinomycetospora lutea]
MAGVSAPEIRVLVVDDDALVRSALTMMLDGADGIRVAGEATDGDEVPALVDAHAPHVVLMDLRMPRLGGLAATRRARERPDPPEVLVLTTFDSDENVLHALRAGAGGFLLKDTPPAEIVEAVQRVAAGDPMLSPTVTRRLMDQAGADAGERERARDALRALSEREYDVAVAIARGRSNAEIASEASMSLSTVKAHVSHVLAKLDLENRTQIALLVHDAER